MFYLSKTKFVMIKRFFKISSHLRVFHVSDTVVDFRFGGVLGVVNLSMKIKMGLREF